MGKKKKPLVKLTENVQAELIEYIACGCSLLQWARERPEAQGDVDRARRIAAHVMMIVVGEDEGFEKFRENYWRAREAQILIIAEDIIQVSDEAVDKDSSAAAKVKLDARKWMLGKLARAFKEKGPGQSGGKFVLVWEDEDED